MDMHWTLVAVFVFVTTYSTSMGMGISINPSTAPDLTNPATAPIPTTTVPGHTLQLEFSYKEGFIPAMSNSTSQGNLTKNQLEAVFRKAFPSFSRLSVPTSGMRDHSIVIIIIIRRSGPVPSTSQVVTTLREAVERGNVTVPINTSSISVTRSSPDGVSPVHHSVFICSLLTLCTLILAVMLDFY